MNMRFNWRMAVMGLLCAAGAGWTACAAELHGDGVRDDAPAIQEMLDSGRPLVALPEPACEYLIRSTLRIGNGQELRLPPRTRIRLADGSDCSMLANRDFTNGNARITITGGIWDMNNLGQRHNLSALFWMEKCVRRRWLNEARERVQETAFRPRDGKHHPDYFQGVCMRLFNVDDLLVRDVTIRNPTTYGIQLWKVRNFKVDEVTFDYAWGNPAKANMDGLHIDGLCERGRITNLHGICFDDFVALNATDGTDNPQYGPISDIVIDGIDCDYCHSAVRLLSRSPEHPIRRVSIRNVKGRFYSYGIGLTYFHLDVKERGVMDDISISDVRMSKSGEPADCWQFAEFGVIEVEKGVDVGRLTIERLVRDEDHRPECDTIRLKEGATVKTLVIRDCEQINRTREPMVFLHNRGSVGSLALSGTVLRSVPGANVEKDERTFISQWAPKWKTLSDISGWPSAADYPKRGAMWPSGRIRAGFDDGLVRVFPFVGAQERASDAVTDVYTEGGSPGYYAVEMPRMRIRAETTVSESEAWFRIRYPEYAERRLRVPGGLKTAFSEPVLRREPSGADTVYVFAAGWQPLVVRVARDELSADAGFDFDRTMSFARRAWNRAAPGIGERSAAETTQSSVPSAFAPVDPATIWDREELYKIPKTWGNQDPFKGEVTPMWIEGEPYRGKPTRLFAFLGLPEGATPSNRVPGIVLVHGGLGTAYPEWVRLWTRRGYAAIAVDNCGQLPALGADGKWLANPDGGPRGWADEALGQVDDPVREQWMYHAIAASVRAHSYLRSLACVDAANVGVTGISWGGFQTCILAALDDRFAYAVPVYGCAFNYEPDGIMSWDRRGAKAVAWSKIWDPVRFLPYARIPFLWVDGTNDSAFQLDRVMRSADLAKGESQFCTRLRMVHAHGAPGEAPAEILAFADHYARGGVDVVRVTSTSLDGEEIVVHFRTNGRRLVRAEVLWTGDGEETKSAERKWNVREVEDFKPETGGVRARLDPSTTQAVVNLVDENGLIFSSRTLKTPRFVKAR